MNTVLNAIWAGLVTASWTEQTATLSGVIGVWLMIRRSLWAFPIGLFQVAVSCWVFYEYKLYADMKLQVFYFMFLSYGWWYWTRGSGDKTTETPVSRLTATGVMICLFLGGVCAAIWGYWLKTHTDAALPYWDATIASYSIVSQWLQSRKKLENWIGWICVNLLAVGVYWVKELYWFSFLYAIFLIMAIGGHREWAKAWRRDE